MLVHDDDVGEAPLGGHAAVRVVDAVGGGHDPGAVVLVPLPAAVAGAAGADEVAHADRVAGLEPRDAAAAAGHHADDLVPARATATNGSSKDITIAVASSKSFATFGREFDDYPGTTGYMAFPQSFLMMWRSVWQIPQ